MCGRFYIEEDDMSAQMLRFVEAARKKAEANGLTLKTGEIFPITMRKWPLPKPSLPIAICSRIPCYQRRVRHTIRE